MEQIATRQTCLKKVSADSAPLPAQCHEGFPTPLKVLHLGRLGFLYHRVIRNPLQQAPQPHPQPSYHLVLSGE